MTIRIEERTAEEFKEIENEIDTSKNPKNEFKLWLTIAAILAIALFFTLGFAFGKISSNDYKCTQNPLVYGIKEFNSANEDNYECNCYGKKSFSFNEERINLNGITQIFSIE